jgi:hypothetical protein
MTHIHFYVEIYIFGGLLFLDWARIYGINLSLSHVANFQPEAVQNKIVCTFVNLNYTSIFTII